MKALSFAPLILVLFFAGCTANQQKQDAEKKPVTAKTDTSQGRQELLQETFQQADTAYNDYAAGRLKPIRENFKRINSITAWARIVKEDLEVSGEGGDARFYYSVAGLEKVATRQFGETFQQLTEYYLLKGRLSFVLERADKYNRPIYYDSIVMKDNNDTEAFDLARSEITEDRSYFENGQLIHQVNNQDCGSPFAKEYLLEEEKRINEAFGKLPAMTPHK